MRDKYIKRKYASEGLCLLSKYKEKKNDNVELPKFEQVKSEQVKSESKKMVNKAIVKHVEPKKVSNLLEFEEEKPQESKSVGATKKSIEEEEEEFGSYSGAATDNSQGVNLINLEEEVKPNNNQQPTINVYQHSQHHSPQTNQNNSSVNNQNLHNNPHMYQNYQHRSAYHSQNHQHQTPYQNMGFSHQSNTPVGHYHNYHQQNLAGIVNPGHLPVNAQYTNFTPITLATTSFPQKEEPKK